ncbi:MAG: transposase [Verrucomicrobia bacterium]|nr:transposase [Verrucomicrobiota bacterium]
MRDDRDRWRFLDGLSERVETYGVVLHQYVLMQNHFHLVVETPLGNCSAFMQSLLTAYTVYFNLRHKRHGHLFDGRYKARLVDGDSCLLSLSRYVHLNPARVAQWCDAPTADQRRYVRSYPWSSYAQYIGRRKHVEFVTYGPTLALIGKRDVARRYRTFVEAGLGEVDEAFISELKVSPLGIGDIAFHDWVHEQYIALLSKARRPEDVAFRQPEALLGAAEVLGVLSAVLGCGHDAFSVRQRGTAVRAFAAQFLRRYAGLEQRAIADVVGLRTGAAISYQLKRYGELVASDRQLRRKAERCKAELDGLVSRVRPV